MGGARHGFDGLVNRRDFRDMRCAFIVMRIGGIKAIDIRQKHQRIGGDHLRHPRRQAVVIPIADFHRRHGVVFINHGDDVMIEQGVERCPCVQMAAAGFRVFRR